MKKKNTGQFRNTVWDPLLITSQIFAIQSVFYTSYGLLTFIVCSVAGLPISVGQIFDSKIIGAVSYDGKLQIMVFLINSLICALSIWFIVQRAKQCLDFTVTAHFVHFLLCCFIVGFPKSGIWWVMVMVSVIITALVSEYLCMRYEMKAIPVTVSGVSWWTSRVSISCWTEEGAMAWRFRYFDFEIWTMIFYGEQLKSFYWADYIWLSSCHKPHYTDATIH